MTGKKWIGPLLLDLWICGTGYGKHGPLLPRPQQIRYGTGSVAVRGMRILFSAAPTAEERFAADELRSWMRERTGLEITIAPYGTGLDGQLSIVLDREGGKDEPLGEPGEQPGPRSREAYNLSVTEQGVKIHAQSSAGIFYGAQELRQLVEGEGAQAVLPIVEIHDWPSMAYRGMMLDISHGPLPTEKEIERQIDFLARWKANQYYLYSEDSIELAGYPLLDAGSRLTQEEVRRIVAYGRQRHIDVIPNFDLYGHQHDLFRTEEYSELSDEPHGTEFDPRNPKVMPLLTDWVNQFADLFPSPFVSIGFDETFQIEAATHATGSAAAPAELFVKQLAAVAGLFEKHGKHVMAYDDIIVKYPRIIPELPPGLIAVAWYYTSEDPTYKRWLEPLMAQHIPHVVQPGVSSYDDIAPDFDTTFENIDTFLAAGRRSGAIGLINSVWADDAQLLFRMSLPGMAYGAAAPWQSVPMDRVNFFSDYARLMYPAAIAPDIASALSNMTIAETHVKKLLGNQSMFGLWEDPFFPTYYNKLAAHREDLHETRIHAEQAETALFHARSMGADSETVNSLMIGSELLDYGGEKFQTPLDLTAIWRKFGGTRPDAERWWNDWESQVTHYDHSYVTDLMDRIKGLEPAYRAEWLEEYTPYRLGAALGRWDAEYQYWRAVHETLRHFNESTHSGDALPPLDTVIEAARPSWARAH
jgi:hexosaminidase